MGKAGPEGDDIIGFLQKKGRNTIPALDQRSLSQAKLQ